MTTVHNDITIRELISRFDNGEFDEDSSLYPKEKQVPKTHIFDENLTIAENHRQIEEHNQRIKDQKQAFRDDLHQKQQIISDTALRAIQIECKLTETQATYIHDLARETYSRDTLSQLQFIEDLCETINKIANHKKK